MGGSIRKEQWYKVAFQLRGKGGNIGKLKYMKDFDEKPSIYNKAGIEDYQTLESYTPIRVHSFYQWFVQLGLNS